MDTWQDRFVQAFGDAAKRSGVLSEMAGRIFGALYLSPGPLSLDEISDRIGASKGNVSVQVRELLTLGMVRKVAVRRSRRHYYEAVSDLWAIATELIGRRLQHEAQTLLLTLESVEPGLHAEAEVSELVRTRLTTMRGFLQMVIGLVEAFRRGEVLRSEMLRKAGS